MRKKNGKWEGGGGGGGGGEVRFLSVCLMQEPVVIREM